ncbi:MAG: response regulator [Bacteroides sp.]|nr:response regulator [Bacteroides sp.]MCM1549503.1 response regulator [Clostridium sp.]
MAKRILVVDDDMMCLKTVQKYLTEEGFDVLGALSGMQAIHIVEEAKLDLLLLDIEMPGLSGFAAIEQIRALQNGKHLPVIFFTGRKDRDTVKCCAAIGAEGYIMKPVEKKILMERVEEVFSRLSGIPEEKTVLIVDSSVDFLKEMKLFLNEYYKVIVISSGKSALDYLSSHTVDAVVVDTAIVLQDEAVAKKVLYLKKEETKIPVTLLTEDEALELKEHYKMASTDVCLKKPVKAEVLLQTLQRQLSGAE